MIKIRLKRVVNYIFLTVFVLSTFLILSTDKITLYGTSSFYALPETATTQSIFMDDYNCKESLEITEESQAYEYMPTVDDLKLHGWTFKEPIFVESVSDAIQVKVAKHPQYEKYAIGVLRSWFAANMMHNEILLFTANLAENTTIYSGSPRFSMAIGYLNGFVLQDGTKMTKFDITWNETKIVVAYIKQQSLMYQVAVRTLDLNMNIWSNELILIERQGVGLDVKAFFIKPLGDVLISVLGRSDQNFFASLLLMKYGKTASVSFSSTWTGQTSAIRKSGYLSNILWDPRNEVCVIVMSLVSDTGSELVSAVWDCDATEILARSILTSQDLAQQGLTVDFGEVSITSMLNFSSFLVLFVGYPEDHGYPVYFRGDYNGSHIIALPSCEIVVESQQFATRATIIDDDHSDSIAVITWIDSTEQVVKYRVIKLVGESFEKTDVSICFAEGHVTDYAAMFTDSFISSFVVGGIHYNGSVSNSIIMASISKIAGGTALYLTIGLKDSDFDYLSDYEESIGVYIPTVGVRHTDPLDSDTDNDDLGDGEEVLGFVRNIPERNIYDIIFYSDPTRIDTDNDELNDYIEVRRGWTVRIIYANGSMLTYKVYSNTTAKDSDKDHIDDWLEGFLLVDPLNDDTDLDGLNDYMEIIIYRTNPRNQDSDGDGLTDREEPFEYWTNPAEPDTDKDGITDYDEVYGIEIDGIGFRTTNPINLDTDGDELPDGFEAYVLYTDPTVGDTDGDGLTDFWEVYVTKTNPRRADTDGDIIPDKLDVLFPNVNDWTYILPAMVALGLVRIHAYGPFRNWRRDVLGLGFSTLEGVLMFSVPEKLPGAPDVSLISSGLTGVFLMTGEISQRTMNKLLLTGAVPILINKGEYTLMWALLKRSYPKIVRQLSKLHMDVEKFFGHMLAEWSGAAEELTEVKLWVLSRLEAKPTV